MGDATILLKTALCRLRDEPRSGRRVRRAPAGFVGTSPIAVFAVSGSIRLTPAGMPSSPTLAAPFSRPRGGGKRRHRGDVRITARSFPCRCESIGDLRIEALDLRRRSGRPRPTSVQVDQRRHADDEPHPFERLDTAFEQRHLVLPQPAGRRHDRDEVTPSAAPSVAASIEPGKGCSGAR